MMSAETIRDPLVIAGSRTEKRIAWLTLFFGAVASTAAAVYGQRAWMSGLLVGTILGWLNFRWLGRGLDALVIAAKAQHNGSQTGQQTGSQTGSPAAKKAVVPWWHYVLAVFRYALIGLVAYVIFIYRKIPLASMMVGLCALAAAAIVASVWEIVDVRNR